MATLPNDPADPAGGTAAPPVIEAFAPPPSPGPDQTPVPAISALTTFEKATPAPAADELGPSTGAATLYGIAPQTPPATPPAAPVAPPVRPKLVVIRGQRMNQEYPVYEGRNTVGRFADRPVDIDLNAQEAEGQVWSSRLHAALTFDRNVLLVEDLNSLNGTWVNGIRIPSGQQRLLKAGDVIQIGTVQLKVVVG